MRFLTFLTLVLLSVFIYGVATMKKVQREAKPTGKYIFTNMDGDTAYDIYNDMYDVALR